MTDALRALFEPATETRVVTTPPSTRRKVCAKCPFGDNLNAAEQAQADMIKARLAGTISGGGKPLWGCHETVRGKAPQICAGFAAWIKPRPDIE